MEVVSFLEKVKEDVEEVDYLDSTSELSLTSSADSTWRRQRGAISSPLPRTITKMVILGFLIMDLVIRPERPYRHLSATLPISLTGVLQAEVKYCDEQQSIMNNEWPLPGLISESHWEQPSGYFKGWAPESSSKLSKQYRQWSPSWASKDMPRGFSRWEVPSAEKRRTSEDELQVDASRCPNVNWKQSSYSPVDDPLRITNLDNEILEPIREALDSGSVRIKHVVYILMESLRPEFFPLQRGSEIHKAILDLSPPADRAMYNERLARLTPHIEKITGVSGGFLDEQGQLIPLETPQWNDTSEEGHGGINVIGGYTAASMSTKSFAANHCGAWPMPVETFDEADTDSYQPCMPQILNFWSGLKSEEAFRSQNFRNHTWFPALFEAMVEAYDRQEVFDHNIGFKHVVTRERLEEAPGFDATDPKFKKVNYFGYAEQVLKPHIKEYITNAVENDQRIWMSHFTSTTHHGWGTPDWFDDMEFMPPGRFPPGHRDFNRYLNTIRFHDAWMGELMQLLDDVGIANETLVVFAGDHGTAFREDDGHQGTYGNPHVSNLRVPITFRHPHLPRVQYHANATTISTLPTILDLLIHSGSLNEEDAAIASDLVHEYEGQSLIRAYKTSSGERRAWNFAVINTGAKMLAVTSADAPWMLVIPFSQVFPYRLADLENDPLELDPIVAWSTEEVLEKAELRFSAEAAQWAREAELVGKWWSAERKRLWKYHLRAKTSE